MDDFERVQRAKEVADELRRNTSGEYYSAKEAINEFNDAIGAGEKTVAGAKLVGKSLFNIGRFITSEFLPNALDQKVRDYEKKNK